MTPAECWSRVDKSGDCWPWMGDRNGEGRGRVRHNGRVQYAYRVAWELAHGEPISPDLLACHHCDNPTCVRPSHIFIGTHSDNARDALAKGIWHPPHVYGERHGAVTALDPVVADARVLYATGRYSQAELARRFNVGQTTIGRWVRGEDRGTADGPVTRFGKGSRPSLQPCGTRAAYGAHLSRKETPCDPCRAANTEYLRAYKARRRAAGAPC